MKENTDTDTLRDIFHAGNVNQVLKALNGDSIALFRAEMYFEHIYSAACCFYIIA